MLLRQPAVLHALLAHLAQMLITYVCHQIDCGAQVPPPCHGLLTPGDSLLRKQVLPQGEP